MNDERLNVTKYDFSVQDEGTIVVLHPENDAARSWIEDNLYLADGTAPEWSGGGVVIEARCVEPILSGIALDGLTIEPWAFSRRIRTAL